MILPYYVYLDGECSLMTSTDTNLSSRVCNVKMFEINILKVEICLTITNKNKSDKNKLPTFCWLKNYLCNKQTHMPV